MKKTILLVLVLVLCLVTKVANADFTFGEPVKLGPPINGPDDKWGGCLSRDGLELYFSSNRPGGYGGYDLWVLKRESTRDEWDPPTNLGSPANSPYDECLPCLSVDGLTLYFSDGHTPYVNPRPLPGRLGGDGNIWKLTRQTRDEPWSAAVNIGPGINSEHAIGPSISVDGLSLYFQSHRPGTKGGCDLMLATRTSISDPFANPVFLQTLNSSDADWCPDISPDGLVLFFVSARPCVGGGTGPYRLWMTTRKSILDPFPSPQVLPPHVNGGGSRWDSGCYDPSLSSDGSTLYFGSDRSGVIGRFDIYEVPIVPILDFNGDGIVDSDDTRIMLDHWHTDESLCDVGPMPWGDGIVDAQDLIVLAEYLLLEDVRLIAHWKLDETKGIIAHNSINSNDGTLSGDPLWQPSGGQVGGALEFDGIDDYISTPFILNPGKGSMGAFAWIKGGLPGQVIISQTGDFGGTWLGIDPAEGKFMTGFSGMYFGDLVSETVVTDGQWHHVGLIYDMDKLHRLLYVDGVMVAEDTTVVAGMPSDGGLHIGAGKDLNAVSFFSGLIDDVRIYNKALSAEEIAVLAN
jgi:hypothetical protein